MNSIVGRNHRFLLVPFALVIALSLVSGAPFELSHSVIAGGGGSSFGGTNTRMDATLGQPAAGQTFTGGQFSMQVGFWQPVVPGSLANISTRLRVDTGDNALIGGFIVTGTQSKKVIIRAIEPSLPLAGVLGNPVLELYSGDSLLESNDNWVDSPNKQEIIDSGVAPTSNLESAIVRTLPANNAAYTAIVRGVNNNTGIAVVEAYDLDRTVDSKLANISTRGFVQLDDDVLIAGTIILGEESQRVIVRAIGPSLSFQGSWRTPLWNCAIKTAASSIRTTTGSIALTNKPLSTVRFHRATTWNPRS